MCTILIAFRHFDGVPLHLAANRDEKRDRPAEGFDLRDRGSVRIYAPKDLEAGGTWLGVNEHGLVAAITNRHGAAPDPDRKSRGELVFDALDHGDPAAAAESLLSLDPLDYNGFHLTMASTDRAIIVWSDASRLHRVDLEPGLHVVTERSFDADASPREDWLREKLEAFDGAPTDLDTLLWHRAQDRFNGTLIDIPEMNYGTRSSTLISLAERREACALRHCEEPPNVPYVDLSARLQGLIR